MSARTNRSWIIDADRAARLRRRQPDVRAQGLRAVGAESSRRQPAAELARRSRHRRARRRPLRGDTRSTTACGASHSRGRGRPACRCSASASACSGCSTAATKRRCPGSGLLAAGARRLPPTVKVPHVGWNALEITRPSPLLEGLADGAQVYFTHSYAAPVTADCVAATTPRRDVSPRPCSAQRLRRAVSPGEIRPPGLRILQNFSSRFSERRIQISAIRTADAVKRIIACLDVRDGCVVKGVKFGGSARPAIPPRWPALQRRRDRRAGHPRRHRDARRTPGAGRDDSRRYRAAVHPADGRRRHSLRSGCRGGDRRRRRQGQHQQAALADPALITRWPSATAARRWSSRSTRSATASATTSSRAAAGGRANRDAVEWAREAEAAAPARSCSRRSIATAPERASTASSPPRSRARCRFR